MNILFITNYDAHRRIAEGWMPSHHLFGANELLECFDSKTSGIIKERLGGGRIDFVSIEHRTIKSIIKLYFKAMKYNVVYDALNVTGKYFAILNKYHLFRPRLVSIYHHPSFKNYMRLGKSDCSVFFTQGLKDIAAQYVHDGRQMVVNNWYPDKKWYDENKKKMDDTKKYDFLDNGKTARNHDLFIRCMRTMPDKKAVIVTDKNHIPSEYREGENIDLYLQDKPNDYTMQQLCMNTRVMAIPLEENGNALLGPIGSTSYMDAIALGMPVVTNKTAAMAKEIEDNGLGCTFDSTEDSMKAALQESLEHYDEISERMRRFSDNHTIESYSQKLRTYICG